MQSGLILKRKVNEQVIIGGNIVITVIGFDQSGPAAKLHIAVPRDIAVHRMEVWDRIQQACDEADANDGTPRRARE